MLTERDLQIIQDNIGRMIELMETHGCVNSPDMSRFKLIQRNINAYYEMHTGLEELDEYIREDWQEAFRSQPRIIDCYIPSDDIDLKAAYNTEFEGCSSLIEYTLHKNWGRRRKWYTRHALESIGKKSNNFESAYRYVVGDYPLQESKVQGISDRIWTFARCLCVAGNDEALVRWFHSDIPAFGYISLHDMSKLERGENIMKYFLEMVPFP